MATATETRPKASAEGDVKDPSLVEQGLARIR